MPKGKHARHRPRRRVLASATTLSLPLLGLFAFASDAGASVIYPTCPESDSTNFPTVRKCDFVVKLAVW